MLDESGRPVLERACRTANAWERARGLLGRPPLATGEGLWIDHCGSVHTFGMRFALDVVFMESRGGILKIATTLRPFHFAGAWGARVALELRAGEVMRLGLKKGMCLTWQDRP
ncbi:MAG: DUF192 domain-containing protein [Gammaproteobacteria bacterium]